MDYAKYFKFFILGVIPVLLLVYYLNYAQRPEPWNFIDGVNLLIHEGGHLVFSLFGQFMYVLGGSLMQVLLPSLFVLYFWRREQVYSAALLLFWVGQNLINVSVYAADAIKMQLPLLGGDSSGHDWHYLLEHMDMLAHTVGVAATIYWFGVIAFVLGAYFAIKSTYAKYSRSV